MSRARLSPPVDLGAWPEFDSGILTKKQRKVFNARRTALELYCANTAVASIEEQTAVNRRQIYRLLAACASLHPDGRVFGWRALVPYTHVATYQRTAKSQRRRDGSGAAGAFGHLLQAYPSLEQWIAEQIRAKRVSVDQRGTDDGLRLRVRGLTKLHKSFLDRCRDLSLSAADYPFNTQHMGIRALATAVRAECMRTFERGAHLAGATHLKGLPSAAGSAPAAQQTLDVVEFDGHRLDVGYFCRSPKKSKSL